MSEAVSQSLDYSQGEPRPHHTYYIPSGDLEFQANNAIFKVHSYFLANHSSVFKDMFALPGENRKSSGPITLHDDYRAWEQLLQVFYPLVPGAAIDPKGDNCDRFVTLTHKYGMNEIESALIQRLITKGTFESLLDAIVAARITESSTTSYENLVTRILRFRSTPSPEQLARMHPADIHTLIARLFLFVPSGATFEKSKASRGI